jgi:glutathione S-transferase
MITLYGATRSRASRCLWLLHELGLEFEQVPIEIGSDELRAAGYLAINPAGKIPALSVDGVVITESMAINLWLAQQHGAPFWPADAGGQGRALQWTLWAAAELEPQTSGIARLKRLGGEGAEARIAENLENTNRLLELPERRLGESANLASDDFSVADINLASILNLAGFFGIEMARFPRLSAWMDAARARPAFKQVYG